MPEKGLTRARLAEHIRKYAPIHIVGCIVAMVITSLIFTSTRYQVPDEREVLIYLADAYTNDEALSGLTDALLEKGRAFDPALERVEFVSLPYNDPEKDTTSAYLLLARTSLGDGDVFFASQRCAESLIQMGLALPLDDALADGWMAGLNLEPVTATIEETGETATVGLRLDAVTALDRMGAMNSENAVVIVASNGTNIQTSMQVAEDAIRTLLEDANADTDASA